MDKISVVIPAYNAEKYLREAVESVLHQTDAPAFEILIVDNASTDRTAELARELAAQYPCVQVFSETKRGAAAARNCGLAHCSGNLILFHDADDLLETDAFCALYGKMQESGADSVWALARDFKSPELLAPGVLPPLQPAYAGALTGCALFRRDGVDAIGGFDETLPAGETIDWMLRYRNQGLPAQTLERVTKNRRIHLTNTMQTTAPNYTDAIRKQMLARRRAAKNQ